MDKTCAECGRRIGAFSSGSYELRDGKVLCSKCADAVKKMLSPLYDVRSAEEFNTVRGEVIDDLSGYYSPEIVKSIGEKIYSIYEQNVLPKISEHDKQQSAEKKATEQREQSIKNRVAIEKLASTQMLTTGHDFCGYTIKKYLGIVSGEVVLGTGFLSEFSASFSDLLGSQSQSFANKLEEAKNAALKRMIQRSAEKGGNAVIGVDFDYITFSSNMIGVVANGTSVIVEK